jgi:hypothetical protein
MDLSLDEVRLVRPTADEAAVIAGWSRSPEQAGRWCSRAEHPFPAAAVRQWWDTDDVEPWLLVSAARTLLAYGELCDDEEEEDEVELARLIVSPDRRRTADGGLERRTADALRLAGAPRLSLSNVWSSSGALEDS